MIRVKFRRALPGKQFVENPGAGQFQKTSAPEFQDLCSVQPLYAELDVRFGSEPDVSIFHYAFVAH